jgi:hypothetical protein
MFKLLINKVQQLFSQDTPGVLATPPSLDFAKLEEASAQPKKKNTAPKKSKKPTKKSLEAMDKKAIDDLAKTHDIKLDRRKKKSTMIDEFLEGLKK